MAEQALGLTLQAIPLAINHGDKIWNPIHHRYNRMRGQVLNPGPHIYDRRTMEEKGLMLCRRRDVASDEEIVEVVKHKGEVLPRHPRRSRRDQRVSSMDNRRALAVAHYRDRRDLDKYYNSEGPVPPRFRARTKSTSGRSRRRHASSGSSSSSSSLASSTEEEKNCHKMQHKKWITAALASVATIQVASKVYSSIEAHDKRIEKVHEGTLSPEGAQKQQRASRWQDAASIGIAALGIKGAVSEWNELSGEHRHHKELLLQREEHHKKRLERRRGAQEAAGYHKGRDGQWDHDGTRPQKSERYRGSSGGGGGAGYDGGRSSRTIRNDADRKAIEYDEDSRSNRSRSRAKRLAAESQKSTSRRKLEKTRTTVGEFEIEAFDEIAQAL